jgi:enamine deaminase RidA (YjgF/YER057c/UK114 family)
MNVHDRLRQLGLELPDPPAARGAYVPALIAGDRLLLSGQFPIVHGELLHRGRLGADLDVEAGREAARLAALNVLAHIDLALGGFDRLVRLLRVEGHLPTTPDFNEHARVLDGASELFGQVLGSRGEHVRAVFGHVSLPLGLPVELVVEAEIQP